MSLREKKRVLIKTIRKLEDRIVAIKHIEAYDGIKTLSERDLEIEVLQGHLRCAHGALVMLVEEESRCA